MQFMIDGIPMIYNGMEISDGTPQDLFSHWSINWKAANLPKQVTRRQWYVDLCKVRQSRSVFANGQTQWVDHDQDECVVAFTRQTDDDKVLCVVSMCNRPVTVTMSSCYDSGNILWGDGLPSYYTINNMNDCGGC